MGDFIFAVFNGVVASLVGIALFLWIADPVHTGRVQVASGEYVCAQDIAGDWRCVRYGK